MMVSVENLKPGMVVAADVVNLNQTVLLKSGSLLGPQELRMLKMWGIVSVNIVSKTEQEASLGSEVSLPAEVLREAEAQVSHRFKHVTLDSPAVQLVRQLAIKRAAAELARAPSRSPDSGS